MTTLFLRSIPAFALLLLLNTSSLSAQGCVAIRHFSSCVGNNLENNLLGSGELQIGVNYRYFKSFRHFRGTEEVSDRVSSNTQGITPCAVYCLEEDGVRLDPEFYKHLKISSQPK